MKRFARVLGFLLPLSASFSVWGQTPWPDYMPTFAPGMSNSAVSAPPWPADTNIESPADDVSQELAKWSGRWTGWACRNKSCDTKLAVEKVTMQGASIIYAIASTSIAPTVGRYDAQFVGEELHATLNSGRKVIYRMKPDGALEFLRLSPSGQYEIAGILAKEPKPTVDVPLTCSTTADQCIQKPNFKIGDRWVYKKIDLYNNQEIERFEQKITGLNMDDVRWEVKGLSGPYAGRTSRRFSDRSTGSFSNSNILEGKVVYFLFPLEAGKTWKHAAKWKRQTDSGTVTTNIEAEVLGREDVEVPAGKFKALKIVHYNNYVGRNGINVWDGSSVETVWYSEDIKTFVKQEFVDRNPTGERTKRELIEYEIK